MDPDPDPTPDPTSFFSDFKDAEKNFIFFSYNLPVPAGTLSSVLKTYFFAKILLNTFMRKRKEASRSIPLTNGS
jgi:hypothetical protein